MLTLGLTLSLSARPQPPTVASVSPTNGKLAAGTTVVITGTNFLSGSTVDVGGSAATSVVVDSPTQITCAFPSGTAGAKTVTVTSGGQPSTGGTSIYTYNPVPVFTSISPNNGKLAGGAVATIAGTGFITGCTCPLGAVVFVSSTELQVTPDPHTAGTFDCRVTNPDTQTSTAGATAYEYVAAPTVTAITPTNGKLAAGTAITDLHGTGFRAGASLAVTIGGASATGVTWVSATQLSCTAPVGTAGAKDVVVTNGDAEAQTSGATGAGLYTYNPVPTVTSLSTALGDVGGAAAGNVDVTVNGTGFISGCTCTLGAVTFVSSTELTVAPGAHAAGAIDVDVTNPDTQISTGGTGAYTYFSPASKVLTSYLDKGQYVVGTWTGLASAGASNGRNFTQVDAAKKPAASSGSPNFDGSNDSLSSGAVAASDIITTSAYTIRLVANLDTVAAPGNVWQEAALWTESGANICITATSDGIRVGHYEAVFKTTTAVALATGTTALIQVWYDGVNIHCQVNDTACAPVAAAALASVAGGVYLGATYDLSTAFIDGLISHVSTMQTDDSANNAQYLAWAQACRGIA